MHLKFFWALILKMKPISVSISFMEVNVTGMLLRQRQLNVRLSRIFEQAARGRHPLIIELTVTIYSSTGI